METLGRLDEFWSSILRPFLDLCTRRRVSQLSKFHLGLDKWIVPEWVKQSYTVYGDKLRNLYRFAEQRSISKTCCSGTVIFADDDTPETGINISWRIQTGVYIHYRWRLNIRNHEVNEFWDLIIPAKYPRTVNLKYRCKNNDDHTLIELLRGSTDDIVRLLELFPSSYDIPIPDRKSLTLCAPFGWVEIKKR